ncbi:unnamed protein product (macronuclear) [Paramecium tetraurelia]|uniref:G domain-containing protein n=1 Tax=Paramecium tetraurelia TaxID=5888 RepID=A0DLX6_PARTE|nr:uncharacterized protein GSPATT00018261001 [Paramecium tetraurelia]CAK84043.1 unnamed protein product [Paramecium tetraurelia]|eukprot:XP_001451440.1 hypothetical protein (macronuclear) [Paramecium tetraurelia strain d4-2]
MIQENDQYQIYEKMIDRISELLITFDKQLSQNLTVAMLVGYTANGKSTLFNFLSGFEFQIKQEENKKSKFLALKYPNQKYASDMANGVKSVTKEPHYYYNKNNNCLLIDFPGFNDTEGAMSQSFISILFNRLVIKTPIRIINVIKTTDGILPNRATEIQSFIARCFGQKTSDFSSVTLVLNQYMDDLNDKDLIVDVKYQLSEFQETANENIAVIRKIKDDRDLEMIFNQANRKQIWKVIEKSNPIKFKPTQFQKQAELANLIHNKCNSIMQNLVSEICWHIDNFLNNLNQQSIEALYEKFYIIELLIKKQLHLNAFSWHLELLDQMQEIAAILGWKNNQKIEIDIFLKIFKFVSQEEDIIQIKDFLKINSQLLQNNLIIQKQTIMNRMLAIEKKQLQDQKERQKIQNENLLRQQQIDQSKKDLESLNYRRTQLLNEQTQIKDCLFQDKYNKQCFNYSASQPTNQAFGQNYPVTKLSTTSLQQQLDRQSCILI